MAISSQLAYSITENMLQAQALGLSYERNPRSHLNAPNLENPIRIIAPLSRPQFMRPKFTSRSETVPYSWMTSLRK